MLNLSRFAEKSAENVVNSIQSKKQPVLDKFIYALGIRHVGEETAFDLAKNFGSLEKISQTSFENLQKIHDIGDVVAKSIYDWFKDSYNQKLLNRFYDVGVRPSEFKLTKASTKLAGKTFVLTGGLETITREDAQKKVRELGGDVSSSVSKETDYVVVGSDPGSKFDKAQKLGVETISEKEFLDLLK